MSGQLQCPDCGRWFATKDEEEWQYHACLDDDVVKHLAPKFEFAFHEWVQFTCAGKFATYVAVNTRPDDYDTFVGEKRTASSRSIPIERKW